MGDVIHNLATHFGVLLSPHREALFHQLVELLSFLGGDPRNGCAPNPRDLRLSRRAFLSHDSFPAWPSRRASGAPWRAFSSVLALLPNVLLLGVDAETKLLARDFSVTLRSTMLALFLSVALPWFSSSYAQERPSGKPSVRTCPDYWNDGVRSGKKSQPTGKKKAAPKQSGACIELAFSPLDIQEYLQSYARQKHWLISDDQLNEDSWTFSLDIDHDELLRDTLPDSREKGVEWKQGTVRVHINALVRPDGFARTVIHASFRGYGRNTDQFAVQREYWDLESSYAFENSLVSMLREHFSQLSAKETPSAPPAH
jgi:hypothetical protein